MYDLAKNVLVAAGVLFIIVMVLAAWSNSGGNGDMRFSPELMEELETINEGRIRSNMRDELYNRDH